MFGLPQSTEIRRPLPKTQFYKKFELKQSQRDAIDADIARMEFVNGISPQTMPAITEGADIKAIFVVEVELKRSDYDKKIISLVAKLIPQRIIFVLRYGKKAQLALYHTKLFVSEWQSADAVSIPFAGLNLDTVWQHMVVAVGEIEIAEGNTLTEQIRADEEHAKLMKQIEQLEKRCRNEKQPRKKLELFEKLKELKSKL